MKYLICLDLIYHLFGNLEMNKKYSEAWPNITKKRSDDVPADQEKWREVKDKLKYLSEKPGKGD